MKKIFTLVFVVFAIGVVFSQTTIYSEDFTGQNGQGAVGPDPTTDLSMVDWTIDITDGVLSASSDWFWVQNEIFEARDIDGSCIWYSPSIDISDYIGVSFNLTAAEDGTMESGDIFVTEYRIDGGTWNQATVDGSLSDDFTSAIPSQTGLSGGILEIRVTMNNNAGSEYHRLDNVLVQGSPASCPLSITINPPVCDAETFNTDTYNYTIDFTGGGQGAGTYTFTSTDGTIGGDNPNTMASGTITITAVNEGTNDIYEITDGTDCNFSEEVTSPVCNPPCGLTLGSPTVTCDTETAGDDTYTISISYSGGNNGDTYVYEVTGATTGGDDPNSVAAGNMVFTGLTEGTNGEFTLTSVSCNEMITVISPTCNAPLTDCSELMISEYIEGSSSNKYIEIYNPSANSIDLSNYDLVIYSNGSTNPSNTISLSGTMLSGDVFVIAHNSATVWTGTPDLTSGALGFNGNDVVALRNNGTNIDVVGTIGSSSNFGANTTLVRNDNVTIPTTDYDTNEWTEHDEDTVDNLGSHDHQTCEVLPVELIKLEAKNTKSSSFITWSTASEINNSHFNVQYSTNGYDFKTIGDVDGNGTSNRLNSYEYVHHTPTVGTNYYRLEQVDYDGKTALSDIVMTTIKAEKTSRYIKSNLISNQIDIELEGEAQFVLRAMNGQLLINRAINNNSTIDVSKLKSGMYIAQIIVDGIVTTERLIK